jgi:hypothetical protein
MRRSEPGLPTCGRVYTSPRSRRNARGGKVGTATLADVITYCEARFEVALSDRQKADLVAFLRAP